MNLTRLFNPAHEHKVEVALHKLAQRYSPNEHGIAQRAHVT